jgi:hypothetical protein
LSSSWRAAASQLAIQAGAGRCAIWDRPHSTPHSWLGCRLQQQRKRRGTRKGVNQSEHGARWSFRASAACSHRRVSAQNLMKRADLCSARPDS